ncbi:ATP-binding protein [Limosilactobacillus fermentum]
MAVSTGVDSMVLLDLLQNLPKLRRPRLIVAHVNHHLRTQSTAEEAFYVRIAGNETFPSKWPSGRSQSTQRRELKRRPAGFATPFLPR